MHVGSPVIVVRFSVVVVSCCVVVGGIVVAVSKLINKI